jgi:hypothetical protein
VRWAVGGLIFLIGVVTGLILPALVTVHFSRTVDVGAVLNAAAVVVIGVLIGYIYAKQSSSKRADTELLLDLVRDANRAFCKLERVSSQLCSRRRSLSEEEQDTLISAERDVSNAVHSIESALRHCGAKLHKLDFDKLKDARIAVKDSLTDSPFPGPYDDSSRRGIRTSLKAMRDELTRITFAINRR